MRTAAMVTVLAAMMACGGRATPSAAARAQRPEPEGQAHTSRPAPAAPAPPLSASECEQLLGHIVDRATVEGATEDDRNRVREAFQRAHQGECREIPRASFECAMKAESTAQIEAC